MATDYLSQLRLQQLQALAAPVTYQTDPNAPGPTEGNSLLGFLGNLVGGVGDVVTGLGSLVGMGIHDVVGVISTPFNYGDPDTSPGQTGRFMLDDLALKVTGVDWGEVASGKGFQGEKTVATPSVIHQDYYGRYGALAPGGRPASNIMQEFYDQPLSFLTDALTVATLGSYGAAKGAQIAGRSAKLAGAVETVGAAKATGTLAELEARVAAGAADITPSTLRSAKMVSTIQGQPLRYLSRSGAETVLEPAFSPYRRIYSNLLYRVGTQKVDDVAAEAAARLEMGFPAATTEAVTTNQLQSAVTLARGSGITRIERPWMNMMQLRKVTDNFIGTSSLRAIQNRNGMIQRFRSVFSHVPGDVPEDAVHKAIANLDLGWTADDMTTALTNSQRSADIATSLTARNVTPQEVRDSMLMLARLDMETVRDSAARDVANHALDSLDGLTADEYNVISELTHMEAARVAATEGGMPVPPVFPSYENILQRLAARESGRAFLMGEETLRAPEGTYTKYQVHDSLGLRVGELGVGQLGDDPTVLTSGKLGDFEKKLTGTEFAGLLEDIHRLHTDAEIVAFPYGRGKNLEFRTQSLPPINADTAYRIATPDTTVGEVASKFYVQARAAINAADRVNLDPVDEVVLEGMRPFLSEDHTGGYYLTPGGEIKGLFETPDAPPGTKKLMVLHALEQGGLTWSGFEGPEANFMTQFGFVPTQRTQFTQTLAPEGWSGGRPDVLGMVYQGGPLDTLAERYGRFGTRTEAFDPGEAATLERLAGRVAGPQGPDLGGGEPLTAQAGMGERLSGLVDGLSFLGEADRLLLHQVLDEAGYSNVDEAIGDVLVGMRGNVLTPEQTDKLSGLLGSFANQAELRRSQGWFEVHVPAGVPDPPARTPNYFWSKAYQRWLHWRFEGPHPSGMSYGFEAVDEDGKVWAGVSVEPIQDTGSMHVNSMNSLSVDPNRREMWDDLGATRHDSPIGPSGLKSLGRSMLEEFPFVWRSYAERVSGTRAQAGNRMAQASWVVPDDVLRELARRDPRFMDALVKKQEHYAMAKAMADEAGLLPGTTEYRQFVNRFQLQDFREFYGVRIPARNMPISEWQIAEQNALALVGVPNQGPRDIWALMPDPDGTKEAHLRAGLDAIDYGDTPMANGIELRKGASPDVDNILDFGIPTYGEALKQAPKRAVAQEMVRRFTAAIRDYLADDHEAVQSSLGLLETLHSERFDDISVEALNDIWADWLETISNTAWDQRNSSRSITNLVLAAEEGDKLIKLQPDVQYMTDDVTSNLRGVAQAMQVTEATHMGPSVVDVLRSRGVGVFVPRAVTAQDALGVPPVLFDTRAVKSIDGILLGGPERSAQFLARLAEAGYDQGADAPGIAAQDMADLISGAGTEDQLARAGALSPEDRWRITQNHTNLGHSTATKQMKLDVAAITPAPRPQIRRTENFALNDVTVTPDLPASFDNGNTPLWADVGTPEHAEEVRRMQAELMPRFWDLFGLEAIRTRIKDARAINEKAAFNTSMALPGDPGAVDDILGFQVMVASPGELGAAVRKLSENMPITRYDNSLLDPSWGGNRMVRAVVDVEGRPVEVQFLTPEMAKAEKATAGYRRLARWYQTQLAVNPALAQEKNFAAKLSDLERLLEGGNETVTDELREAVTGVRITDMRRVQNETRLTVMETFETPMIEFYGLEDFDPRKMLERAYRPMSIQRGSIFDQSTGKWQDPKGASARELDDMMAQHGLPMPVYFPYFDYRRIKPSDFIYAKKTNGLRSMTKPGYERTFTGYLTNLDFQYVLKDPVEAYSRRAAQAIRREEALDLTMFLTKKMGHRVQSWEELAEGEVLFAPDGFLRFYRMRQHFDDSILAEMQDTGEMIDDKVLADKLRDSIARTQDDVASLLARINNQVGLTRQGVELWAIPKVVADRIEAAVRPKMGMKTRLYWDTPTQIWRSLVLQGSPRWIINNIIGNTIFLKLQGGRLTDVVRQLSPRFRRKVQLAIGEGQRAPVEAGLVDSLPTTHLGSALDTKTGQFYAKVSESLPVQTSRKFVGLPIRHLNNIVEDAFRRASYLTAAERAGLRSGIQSGVRRFWSSKRTMETVSRVGLNEKLAAKAIDEMNYFMNDYTKMSPLGRQVIRRFIAPFWSFYKHIGQLIVTLPFEHPDRFLVMRLLTEAASEMAAEFGPVPDWAEGSIPLGAGDEPGETRFLSTAGPNPFSFLENGINIASVAHPAIKMAVEQSLGRSTLTGRPFSDPNVVTPFGSDQQYRVWRDEQGVVHTEPIEKVAPSLAEALLRQVPQYKLLEDLVAGGRTYDTSTLFDVIRSRIQPEGTLAGAIRDPATGEVRYPLDSAQKLLAFGGVSTFDINQFEQAALQREQSIQAIRAYLRRLNTLSVTAATPATLPAGSPVGYIGGS